MMHRLARPFTHANAVVLCIFASVMFIAGLAVAYHPYITERLGILHAPKLALLIRVVAILFFSIYCTLGCLCRILIQFFPEEFSDGIANI